jgi:hypothetical protein
MKDMKSQEEFIQTIIKDYRPFVLNTLSSPTFFGGSSRVAVGWYSPLCHGNINTLFSSLTLCSIITATSCYTTALIKSEQPLLPQRWAMAYYLEAEISFLLWDAGMTFLHKLLSNYTGSVRIAINGLRMFVLSVDSAILATGK